MLDGDVTDGQGVLRNKTLHGSRAILDRELCAIRLVGRGSARVILGVKEARNGSALGTRDPEVA